MNKWIETLSVMKELRSIFSINIERSVGLIYGINS